MKYFVNKTVIVTGSGSGIGKTIAQAFLSAGANIVINARSKDKLDETCKEFEEKGFHPLAVAADVSKETGCKLLVQSALERFGRIDCLINNAGLSMRGRFEDLIPEVFPEIITANLLTAVSATRVALPEIVRTEGSIIFISSITALHGMPNMSPYSAAKAALDTFAESLRIELSCYRVHIGLIHVGIVSNHPGKKVMGHDGSYITVSRKGQLSQDDVARAVIRMVRKRRPLMTLTIMGKLIYFLEKISPSLVQFSLKLTRNSAKYR